MILAENGKPRLIRVDEHKLGDFDLVGQPGDPVHELGRVGRASTNHSEVHPNAFTSAPDWATWQAASWPSAMGSSCGVTAWHVSIAIGQRHRNRQPGVGLITFGGSPRSVSAPTPSSARGSGAAESSSCVYGCLGLDSTSSIGPVSAI